MRQVYFPVSFPVREAPLSNENSDGGNNMSTMKFGGSGKDFGGESNDGFKNRREKHLWTGSRDHAVYTCLRGPIWLPVPSFLHQVMLSPMSYSLKFT